MNRLRWIELRATLPDLLGIYGFCILGALLLKSSFHFVLVPAIAVYMLGFRLRRTNWYLNLPCSRLSLASFIVTQCLLVFAINLLLTAPFFFILDRVFGLANTLAHFRILLKSTAVLGLASVGLTSSALAFFGRPRNVLPPQQQVRRGLIATFFLTPFVGVCWTFNIFSEPIFLFSCLVIVPFGLLVLLAFQVNLPAFHSARLLKVSYGAIGAIIVLTVSAALVLAHAAPVENRWTQDSLFFLHRFPAGLSTARAVDLFANSQAVAEPAMLARIESLRKEVDAATWEKRTRQCHTQGCLDLSAAAVDFDTLEDSQFAERFLVLQNDCKLEFDHYGKVRCRGAALQRETLDQWLQRLERDGVLAQWLNEEEPQRLLIAIKGLGLSYTDEQSARLSSLAGHANSKIAASAKEAIALRAERDQFLSNCTAHRKKPCEFSRTPASFFH